jgi:CHASE3 domain sensor protein
MGLKRSRMRLDLSIGQRLGIATAALLLLLAALAFTVFEWHESVARVQSDLTQRVLPLADASTKLERALFQIALSLRKYLLTPSPSALNEYQADMTALRDALQRVGELRKDPQSEAVYRALVPSVETYIAQTQIAVRVRSQGALGVRLERTLGNTREMALSDVTRFALGANHEARSVLEYISSARETVYWRVLIACASTGLVLLALVAVVTASLRRQWRALMKVADGFRNGNWRPALALARRYEHADGHASVRDEMAVLSNAFAAAAAALEEQQQRLFADAQTAHASACALREEEIGSAALPIIVEYTRSEFAVLYSWKQDSQNLQPIAQYGFETLPATLRVGEGMAGQVAKHRRAIVSAQPDTALNASFGLDAGSLRSTAALPVVMGEELLGVLLVTAVHEFDHESLSFLRVATSRLASGLKNAATHGQLEQRLARFDLLAAGPEFPKRPFGTGGDTLRSRADPGASGTLR